MPALFGVSLEAGFPVQIIAGIRSEIVGAVSVLGKEINKSTSDFGVNISWHGRDESLSHALFDIIARKVQESERRLKLSRTSTDIWSRYFPRAIGNDEFWKFVMWRSWYRPRDFVRRFNLAQNKCIERENQSVSFNEQDFRKSNKDYSTQSWIELTEELQASYSREEISAIRQVLTGFNATFMLGDLEARILDVAQTYPRAKALVNRDASVLVEDLYRIGIIGNNYYDRGGKASRGLIM